jgi:branched-chain amino acid transport system ATP-binding protein
MFRPEGVFKEKQIKTIDSIQAYANYLNKKKSNDDVDFKIQKADSSKFGNPEASDIIIDTQSVNKTFGGVVALDNVSISVKRGSLLGIIGPNGSGKSTFFNVLTGLLEQDKNREGTIKFFDHDITTSPVYERAKYGLGRTFQQSRLFENLTVLENVLVAAKNQKGINLINAVRKNWVEQETQLHEQAFQILEYLNILHIWNNKASDISGGQQKLVALARSLMSQSHVVLLDEPVAGVNPTLAKKIFEKIQHLYAEEKHNYVIIEHNMDVQLNFCDYIFVFNRGEIVAEGTPEEIKNNKKVLDAYLGY